MAKKDVLIADNDRGYQPRIIVKFEDDFEIPYEDGAERNLQGPDREQWERLVRQYPQVTLNRLLTVATPKKIQAQVEQARQTDPEYDPPNLLTYFRVDTPPGISPGIVADSFMGWPAVQTAYEDPESEEPFVNPTDNPEFSQQGYLKPAPIGIDAVSVWPQSGNLGYTGGDGAGIDFIDLERGWMLDHPDLLAHAIPVPLTGSVRDNSRSHGTRVLGVVCAVDNTFQCIGIAPNVGSVRVVSHFGATFADALLAGVQSLSFGDVFLLEAQIIPPGKTRYHPVEVVLDRFDLIRLATAVGIVVVEAGGNGNTDLDNYTDGNGKKILDRNSPDFQDSGAVMVGAAVSTVPHSRYIDQQDTDDSSNYGSRIDCYAWGDCVTTLDADNTGQALGPTHSFKRTSAATAIIAGAALVVQGIVQASLSYRFSARQIRGLLSDPASSTPSASNTDRIGVMPDLKAIVQNQALKLVPDIYLRDHVGDDGDPHNGVISASPDIILLPDTVAEPQSSFGEGSGTENNAALGSTAVAGQDNYIYVRVRNRGGSAASNVTATVYWAPVASLLTPDLWTEVGTATLAGVAAGDTLTVSAPITWNQSKIPAAGHYCFVALLGSPQDPAPDPAGLLEWELFRRFIRENNNVTWRNFNVVSNVPETTVDPEVIALPFLAPGAPDGHYMMQLGVGAKLPVGAKIYIEIPEEMFSGLEARRPDFLHDARKQRLLVPINPQGGFRLKPVLFQAGSRRKLRLLVHIPKKHRKLPYEVYVNQLFEGREMGRVTWRLASPG